MGSYIKTQVKRIISLLLVAVTLFSNMTVAIATEEAAEPATAPATFEPGDPIPAQTAVPAEKEKAKRPRKFFDLFVKQTKKVL